MKTPRVRAIVRALVETLVPPFPPLEREATEEVLSDVTRFVETQIRHLPTYLRVPYTFGLLVFDLGALLYERRTFRRCAPSGREVYLARWAQSKFGPLQDFVKLVRSCGLFAYFDHPIVLAELERERRGVDIPTERRARAF